jgi:hypothetical protein
MTGRVFGWLGIKNGVGLVETEVDGSSRSVDVMAIDCPGDLRHCGSGLDPGKQLVALVQQEIVTAQSRDHGGRCVAPAELCARGAWQSVEGFKARVATYIERTQFRREAPWTRSARTARVSI